MIRPARTTQNSTLRVIRKYYEKQDKGTLIFPQDFQFEWNGSD